MKKSVTAVRESFSDAVNRVAYGGERVILERRGKKVAALIPMEDLKLLEQMEDEADIKAAKKALKEYKKHGGITVEEYRKKRGI